MARTAEVKVKLDEASLRKFEREMQRLGAKITEAFGPLAAVLEKHPELMRDHAEVTTDRLEVTVLGDPEPTYIDHKIHVTRAGDTIALALDYGAGAGESIALDMTAARQVRDALNGMILDYEDEEQARADEPVDIGDEVRAMEGPEPGEVFYVYNRVTGITVAGPFDTREEAEALLNKRPYRTSV